MNDINLSPSANQESDSTGYRASAGFLAFLDRHIEKAEDIYENLEVEYRVPDPKVPITEQIPVNGYKDLENIFTNIGKEFQDKFERIFDPDYLFLKHGGMRKQITEQIISMATVVAQKFQEAAKAEQVDRPLTRTAIRSLINAIKNLRELAERANKT